MDVDLTSISVGLKVDPADDKSDSLAVGMKSRIGRYGKEA